MPTYTFRNNETGEGHTTLMKISECEEYLAANPYMEQIPVSINLHSGTGLGVRKVDEGFKDILREKKKFYGKDNTINV